MFCIVKCCLWLCFTQISYFLVTPSLHHWLLPHSSTKAKSPHPRFSVTDYKMFEHSDQHQPVSWFLKNESLVDNFVSSNKVHIRRTLQDTNNTPTTVFLANSSAPTPFMKPPDTPTIITVPSANSVTIFPTSSSDSSFYHTSSLGRYNSSHFRGTNNYQPCDFLSTPTRNCFYNKKHQSSNQLQHKHKLQIQKTKNKNKAKTKATIMSKSSVSQSYQSNQVTREGDK